VQSIRSSLERSSVCDRTNSCREELLLRITSSQFSVLLRAEGTGAQVLAQPWQAAGTEASIWSYGPVRQGEDR